MEEASSEAGSSEAPSEHVLMYTDLKHKCQVLEELVLTMHRERKAERKEREERRLRKQAAAAQIDDVEKEVLEEIDRESRMDIDGPEAPPIKFVTVPPSMGTPSKRSHVASDTSTDSDKLPAFLIKNRLARGGDDYHESYYKARTKEKIDPPSEIGIIHDVSYFLYDTQSTDKNRSFGRHFLGLFTGVLLAMMK